MVIFGHAWLIVKLLFFMYFFAGGGGWYRPVMIGTIAAVVYLANLGIFEGQFDATLSQTGKHPCIVASCEKWSNSMRWVADEERT